MKATTRLFSSRSPVHSLCGLLAVAWSACGQPAEITSGDEASQGFALSAVSSDAKSCDRSPKGANRVRKVVVSHPFSDTGGYSQAYEVLELSADGALSTTGQTFNMGTLSFGRIVFTPDGKVGLAAQDDGTIGVFRFDAAGTVHVVYTGFKGVTYATGLVMDETGERVYVLSDQWREYGGGIYSAHINCDGTLETEGLLAQAKLPAGMVLLPSKGEERPQRAVIAAKDLMSSAEGDNVHIVRWPALPGVPKLLGGTDGFGDDESIVSAVARTEDAKYALIGDNNAFSGNPNRVAVVGIGAKTLTPTQLLAPIEDPVSIVTSPWNNAALVVSGFGDAVFTLKYDPSSTTAPFTDGGELKYSGRRPQLPTNAEQIERGKLRGRVLIAELEGVRQVAFNADGSLTDIGLTPLGDEDSISSIVGAVGVQP